VSTLLAGWQAQQTPARGSKRSWRVGVQRELFTLPGDAVQVQDYEGVSVVMQSSKSVTRQDVLTGSV
jgi:hypothetical protein